MLAGAFTESTVIGTADRCHQSSGHTGRGEDELINNIPVAYAVTYLVGTAFVVWFLPAIGPRLMRVNLREEGKKFQAEISSADGPEPGVQSAIPTFGVRAYRVTNEL